MHMRVTTDRPHSLPAALLPVLALVLLAGCQYGKQEPPKDPVQLMASYGALPRLNKTHHQGLRDELALIVADGGTPELLSTVSGPDAEGNFTPKPDSLPDADNVAAGLRDLLPAKTVEMLLKSLGPLMPEGEFRFHPVTLQKAITLAGRYQAVRNEGRAALARPEADFQIQHTLGLAADLSFLDTIQLYLSLEAIAAAERLNAGEPAGALEPLAYMMRLVSLLSAEPRLETRLAAAEHRQLTLRLLAAIAQHPQADLPTLLKLRELLALQIDQWPPDANAWVGDRALGLHIYEMIRDGQVLSVLTPEEYKQFSEDGTLKELTRAIGATLEKDQHFYLRTMRKQIDSCEAPYYQRVEQLNQVKQELTQLQASAEYPLVADRILLLGLEEANQRQAADRADCEAWLLALSAASGATPPDFEINPRTGRPYIVRVDAERALVEGVLLEVGAPTVMVPIPPAARQP